MLCTSWPEITDYYWYRQKKIPIKQIANKSFVIFESSDKDALLKSLSDRRIWFDYSSIRRYTHGGIEYTKLDYYKSSLKRYESAELDISHMEALQIKEIIYAAPFYLANNSKKNTINQHVLCFFERQRWLSYIGKEYVSY